MNPQHHFPTASWLIVFSTATFLATGMAIAPCDATDRSALSAESARRRDLVNRPDCWSREHSDEWYRCAAGNQ